MKEYRAFTPLQEKILQQLGEVHSDAFQDDVLTALEDSPSDEVLAKLSTELRGHKRRWIQLQSATWVSQKKWVTC